MEQYIQSTTTKAAIAGPCLKAKSNTFVMTPGAAKYVKSKGSNIVRLMMRQPSSVEYENEAANQGKVTYRFTLDDWAKNIWLLDAFTVYLPRTEGIVLVPQANLRIYGRKKDTDRETPLICVEYALEQSPSEGSFAAHPDESSTQMSTYLLTPLAIWDAAGEKSQPVAPGAKLMFPTVGSKHSQKQTSTKYEMCITATIDQNKLLTEMARLASLGKSDNAAVWLPSFAYNVVQVKHDEDGPTITAIVAPLTDSLAMRITSTGTIIVECNENATKESTTGGESLPLVVFPTPSMN